MATRAIALWTVLGVVATLSARVQAGGPDDLDGPSAADLKVAQRFAATFRGADGIERAIRELCCTSWSDDPRQGAAEVVLVERAAAAMPKLLDLIVAGKRSDASDDALGASYQAVRIAAIAICRGRTSDRYRVDRRSDATVERSRAAARRTVVGALAGPGARRGAAADALVLALPDGVDSLGCDDGPELVRQATPALVKMLSANEDKVSALHLLALPGADRTVAAPAIRPYLADRKLVAWAAIALAAMGEDVAPAAALLAELLDGPEVEGALAALAAIGPHARAALPGIVELAKRIDRGCARPVKAEQLIAAVAAIATGPGDAIALPALSPILSRCPSMAASAAAVIARLGTAGRDTLVAYLRDDGNAIRDRLNVATVLTQTGSIARDDQDVVHRLELKAARYAPSKPVAQVTRAPRAVSDSEQIAEAGDRLTTCRAEAGLKPVAMTTSDAEQAGGFGWCLERYLCGPSRSALVQTLDRCCGEAFGGQRPAFCRP